MPTKLIYHLTAHYTKLTVWECDPRTRSRICQHTVTPKEGLTKKQRYDTLAKSLYRDFGIVAPVYRGRE